MIRDTIIYNWEEVVEKQRKKQVVDNRKNIERLQKKIDDLKNRWTRHQTPTRKRLWVLAWYNKLISEYEEQIRQLGGNIEKTNYELESKIKWQLLKQIPWYFPTPMWLVEKMVELADIQDWDVILEPSAWTGNIVDWILEKWLNNIIYINEWNRWNYEILLEKYKEQRNQICFFNDDFMTFEKMQHFHRIIMNPPFEKLQDMKHILKARELLKKDWILIAISSAWVKFRREYQEFRDFIDEHWYMEDLQEWTFKDSWTMVNSVLIYLQK